MASCERRGGGCAHLFEGVLAHPRIFFVFGAFDVIGGDEEADHVVAEVVVFILFDALLHHSFRHQTFRGKARRVDEGNFLLRV